MGRYLAWLNETRGLDLRSYDDAWRWSVAEPGRFWRSVWDHFEVIAHLPPRDNLDGQPDAAARRGSPARP